MLSYLSHLLICPIWLSVSFAYLSSLIIGHVRLSVSFAYVSITFGYQFSLLTVFFGYLFFFCRFCLFVTFGYLSHLLPLFICLICHLWLYVSFVYMSHLSPLFICHLWLSVSFACLSLLLIYLIWRILGYLSSLRLHFLSHNCLYISDRIHGRDIAFFWALLKYQSRFKML